MPAESIENVIAFGLGGSEALHPTEKSAILRPTWFAQHSGGKALASSRIAESPVMPMPATFSRYSTLEVDKEIVRGDAVSCRARTVAIVFSSGGSALATDRDIHSITSLGWKQAKTRQEDEDAASRVRYLVLCRVVVGVS